MAKLLGACFILMASYLFGVKILVRDAEDILLFDEVVLLYRILVSEIRNTRTPLPLLFGELSERTDCLWHNFFLNFLLRYLKI